MGLILFALNLSLMATNRLVTKGEVMLIVFADIAWLIASAAIVLLAEHVITGTGLLMIGVVAAFVAFFATGQYAGAGRIVAPKSRVSILSKEGKLTATVVRAVDAPAETVWNVMTDHPGYADVASNVSKVEVLSGEGIGMQRRCFGPKGENWTETCDYFDAGREYGFKIDTKAPDYPYPISDLRGRWSVVPKGTGSEFSIDIEAMPKGGFLARTLFFLLAKRQFKTVLVDLADAWSRRMENEARD
ncbi:MAG: SRPBCC family protein [Anderseniella sp.]